MVLVKEIITKSYQYEENGSCTTFVEEIEQYHYRNEEEKNGHSQRMKKRGFEDSGQVKENIGTILKPNHVWFGSYYRYNRSKWRRRLQI